MKSNFDVESILLQIETLRLLFKMFCLKYLAPSKMEN